MDVNFKTRFDHNLMFEWVQANVHLDVSSSPCYSLFFLIHWAFLFSYLVSNLLFPLHPVLYLFSSDLFVYFSFIFVALFYLYCFVLTRYLLSHHSFANIFCLFLPVILSVLLAVDFFITLCPCVFSSFGPFTCFRRFFSFSFLPNFIFSCHDISGMVMLPSFRSWYLGDSNVDFFSFMIFSLNSSLFLSSCINIDVVLLCYKMFWFSVFCVSTRLGRSSWA